MKLNDLIAAFSAHDRRALAQAITLVESDNEHDRSLAREFLSRIHVTKPTLRIALSGPPGVGKSTLINVLGQRLRTLNFKIAILPIDPASEINRGSLLADKTRMGSLLDDKDIYIRPSSSRAILGGVSSSTHDVMFVVESFGFDAIIIETVGVGQSESLAYALSDHFVVLMQPGAGDQLQALKKGILERADMIVVNKWDELKTHAEATFNMLKSHTHAPTFLLSAKTEDGIDGFIASLLNIHDQQKDVREERRLNRLTQFFYFALERRLLEKIYQRYELKEKSKPVIESIVTNKLALAPALERYIDDIL